MEKPVITKECVKPLLETKFIKLYDLQYAEGKHYFDATRRSADNIVAVKTEEEFRSMLPDAVSCFLIVKTPDDEPRLLTFYEYRYPLGQFVLSIPAGLMDKDNEDIAETMVREIKEETGITVTENDSLKVVNRVVFNTSGMTDESTAIVCAVVNLPDLSSLNQNGAEGSECFDGFVLLTKQDALRLLKKGTDDHDHYYPTITWAAMTYFVSGLWIE